MCVCTSITFINAHLYGICTSNVIVNDVIMSNYFLAVDEHADLRPKGRGRPQRILLGYWPEDHIQNVIRAVVFRDPQNIKDEPLNLGYPRLSVSMAHAFSSNLSPFPSLSLSLYRMLRFLFFC